jgi:hypothetical protein
MFTKCWLILKDDSKMTFEICGQETNTNSFTNRTYAMQKAGMQISCVTPPVTNHTSSKEKIKLVGYKPEEGLEKRLIAQHREITMRDAIDPFE